MKKKANPKKRTTSQRTAAQQEILTAISEVVECLKIRDRLRVLSVQFPDFKEKVAAASEHAIQAYGRLVPLLLTDEMSKIYAADMGRKAQGKPKAPRHDPDIHEKVEAVCREYPRKSLLWIQLRVQHDHKISVSTSTVSRIKKSLSAKPLR